MQKNLDLHNEMFYVRNELLFNEAGLQCVCVCVCALYLLPLAAFGCNLYQFFFHEHYLYCLGKGILEPWEGNGKRILFKKVEHATF